LRRDKIPKANEPAPAAPLSNCGEKKAMTVQEPSLLRTISENVYWTRASIAVLVTAIGSAIFILVGLLSNPDRSDIQKYLDDRIAAPHLIEELKFGYFVVDDKTSAIYYAKIRVGNRGDSNSRFELHSFHVYKHKEVIGVDTCTNEDFDKVVADYRTPTEREETERRIAEIIDEAKSNVERRNRQPADR
jgi:hypothetical protein